MRGRPLWPPAVPRLAARPSQSNPRGSGPEVLKRERGHVTAATGVAKVAVFGALQRNDFIHWGQVMLICANKQGTFGSSNGLLPVWHQAITWTSADLLSMGPLGKKINETRIKIKHFLSTYCIQKCCLWNIVVLFSFQYVNSLRLSDAYTSINYTTIGSDNPLSEQIMVCCQLRPKENVVMKFSLKFKSFHSRKCIWKCCLQKWWSSCLSLNVLTHWQGCLWDSCFPWLPNYSVPSRCLSRDHFVHAPNQWEMTLQCNIISHWLGALTKWSLFINMDDISQRTSSN